MSNYRDGKIMKIGDKDDLGDELNHNISDSDLVHQCLARLKNQYTIDADQNHSLWNLCEKFIEMNKIGCAETIWQSDHVIQNAYEFIEEICEIVGYKKNE